MNPACPAAITTEAGWVAPVAEPFNRLGALDSVWLAPRSNGEPVSVWFINQATLQALIIARPVVPPQDVFLAVLVEVYFHRGHDGEARVRIVRNAAVLPDADHVVRAGSLARPMSQGKVPDVPAAVPRVF